MQDLKISLIQSDLHWEDINANIQQLEIKINQLDPTDLIVLPEMFTTGFTMNSRALAVDMNGGEVSWMKRMASSKNSLIVGSMIVKEQGKFFNRLIWAFPDGKIEFYDKRHLFRMAEENSFFDAGKKRTIIQYKGWNINGLICYDLRFPIWSRSIKNEYDLLIYVASWPEPRRTAWKDLLKARAHENQCFVVGVNRAGEDGKGMFYTGDSAMIDFKGTYLIEPFEGDGVKSHSINLKELKDYKEKFPAYMDADNFNIEIL